MEFLPPVLLSRSHGSVAATNMDVKVAYGSILTEFKDAPDRTTADQVVSRSAKASLSMV